jgi:hypothetical protein
MADAASTRFTLRQLPLPAKLVVSVFLVSVGLGYFSALVQLHLRHGSRNGEALPTSADVVERFAGVKKAGPASDKSRIEDLIMGRTYGEMSSASMGPAFFAKSSGYAKDCRDRGKEKVDTEREGERQLLRAWVRADAETRKKTYAADKFPIPADLSTQPVTDDFVEKDAKTFAVKTLIDTRCGKCHPGDHPPSLESYKELEPLCTPPKPDEVLPGGWVRSNRQMSVDALTQSTHAHLLSFSMLFALTGLAFAFTNYARPVRLVVAPLVLIAQVLDIACWWLARVPGPGPYFAMAIVGTGGVVGLGLGVQIVATLFDLYGRRGKFVLVVLFLLAGAGVAAVYTNVLGPALTEERQSTKS